MAMLYLDTAEFNKSKNFYMLLKINCFCEYEMLVIFNCIHFHLILLKLAVIT